MVPSTDSTIEDTLDTDTVTEPTTDTPDSTDTDSTEDTTDMVTATVARSPPMLKVKNPSMGATTVTPDSTDMDSTEDTTDTDTVTVAPSPLTSRDRKVTPNTTADTLTDMADTILVTVTTTTKLIPYVIPPSFVFKKVFAMNAMRIVLYS